MKTQLINDSTFAEPQQRGERPERNLAPGDVGRANMRVLIVEDDRHLSLALKERLEAEGMKVSTETNAAGARWDLLTQRHDVVLLDLGLPDQSGLDVMLEVASRSQLPPVVVLTGAEESDCELARLLGAAYVLQKPCPYWFLLRALENAVER